MNRILVIEDDADIALSLKYNLEKDGAFRVTCVRDGETGLEEARAHVPDLVLLDLNLPGMDGLDLCRRLGRDDRTAGVPVIMLTARVEESDRVSGLEIGADDYITKPFSIREVRARVRAVLRRGRPGKGSGTLRGGSLVIEPETRKVHCGAQEVRLTRREFDLLYALAEAGGRVLGRERLLEKVWGYDFPGETRTVDVHVRKLRKKLGPEADRIETVVGVGYRFRGGA